MTTAKPSRERRQAMARPIPREAPVTSAVGRIAIVIDCNIDEEALNGPISV